MNLDPRLLEEVGDLSKVVELRLPSDNLKPLQEKMGEYMKELGVQLVWLLDRKNRKVYVYRPNQEVEI